jgi:hypothetical protein
MHQKTAIALEKAPLQERKHSKIIDRTYQNNTNSDYTEQIETLAKNFDYSSQSQHYWGPVELSTLYGTPLYEQASPSQKLALNHLYWVGQYNHTSAAEANTMLFNQVTEGVFANIGGYETLCRELKFETHQETFHVRAFQKIGYQTKLALLGKAALGNPVKHKKNTDWLDRLTQKNKITPWTKNWETYQESTFRSINKMMFRDKAAYYSRFLQEKGKEKIPTTTGGLAGITASASAFKFFSLSWGSSPFLACQYYSARMIANMSLKAYEHHYFKYFRDLENQEQFIPIPTAISHYHLLDESFHTTMSGVISQDVYRDFAKPNQYETFLANSIIYLAQKGILGGLSGGIPATFRNDASFMLPFYRLLRSPLFDLSVEEALQWMEKCLCREHQGFHNNLKHHQHLLKDFQGFFSKLDYLLPINREMRLMAAGGSIERAIQTNIKAFGKFKQVLE